MAGRQAGCEACASDTDVTLHAIPQNLLHEDQPCTLYVRKCATLCAFPLPLARSGWNQVDTLVVMISLVVLVVEATVSTRDLPWLRALKAMR